MSAIWKFTLSDVDSTVVMPKGAKVLEVATQVGEPTIWALVDPNADMVKRQFAVVGTGHPTDGLDPEQYLGTCHNVANLGLVMHVFEVN